MIESRFLTRTFQLWEYRVSHGSLLIRSPKNFEVEKNIDIVCTGVEYLVMPRFMRGLELERPTSHELKQASDIMGRTINDSSLVIFFSSGKRFQVVAATFRLEENTNEIFDSPF